MAAPIRAPLPEPPAPLPRRVWVFAFGSRGDVQPYVAVACALRAQGCDVLVLCSGPSFAAFAARHGCRARAFSDRDFDDVMRHNPLMMEAMAKGDILTFYKGMDTEHQMEVEKYCRGFRELLEQEAQPDLTLMMPLTNYFGWYLAVKHKVPFLQVTTHGAVYNPECPPFGLPRLPLGLTYYLIYYVIGGAIFDGTRNMDRGMGADVLDRYPRAAFLANLRRPPLPVLILTAPEVAHVLAGDPAKLPPSVYRLTGPAVLPAEEQLARIDNFGGPKEFDRLQMFLAAASDKDQPIVYLGWGSMLFRSPAAMAQFCAEAVHRTGYRAVVLGGFAGLSLELLKTTNVEPKILEYAKENILFVQQAPHEWLFPRVRVIVHHGGAGTTMAALRAGVPSIITPVFADQWDFSYFLRKTGVGIGFDRQLHRIDSTELGNAIRKAVEDPEMKTKAAVLGEKLRQEDGTARAVAEIEEYWREYCVTGRFHDIFPGKQNGETFVRSSWFRGSIAVGTIAIVAYALVSVRKSNR